MGAGASKMLSCPVCGLSGLKKSVFVEHFRREHNRVCTKCGLSGFETEESLHKHYDKQHNPPLQRKIECPMCSTKLENEKLFLQHMSNEHAFHYKNPNNEFSHKCPQCGKTKDSVERLQNHIKEHHVLKCLKCEQSGFENDADLSKHDTEVHPQRTMSINCPLNCNDVLSNADDFVQHLSSKHNFSFVTKVQNKSKCPACNKEFDYQELIVHMNNVHIKPQQQQQHDTAVVCPRCESRTVFATSECLVEHLRKEHDFSSNMNVRPLNDAINKRLPKVGDRILAMWSESMWQYFHAEIFRVMPDRITFEINWDDGDTTGRFVEYQNLAIDQIPDHDEIGIGSIILFSQGGYRAGATQLTGGQRWHQGQITRVYEQSTNGVLLYDGHHTKDENDGKFSTYKGYSYTFTGLARGDLRVGPNVFDMLEYDEQEDDTTGHIALDDIDIYFSYVLSNLDNERDIDPTFVAQSLKSKGLNLIDSHKEALNAAPKDKLAMMKNSKVFVACISDDYVENETCRMEFQFAKSTLRKPVVPLVFGGGMDWQLSVVGMLISGELFIHLKDKSVQEQKFTETLKSLSAHLDKLDGVLQEQSSSNNINDENETASEKCETFLSYCWANSYMADQAKQIFLLFGNKHNDPRLIQEKLSGAGITTWLDIIQLKSGDQGIGLFEQLAAALKETRVFVPCVSDEYASSVNCRMEFQFACKALKKPTVPLIVGSGDNWTETVVGMLIKTDENIQPVDLRKVNTMEDLESALEEALTRIKTILDKDGGYSEKVEMQNIKTRKPKIGDHVVSHHFKHCYYTATVAGYEASTMEYTVNWDDGDPSGRVQSYDQVALDAIPEMNDVGVDSVIFFPQGSYGASEGNNTGGIRYHEGVITKVTITDDQMFINGHHTRGEEDGKFCGYRDYEYEFHNVTLESIRLAASALDTME